MPVIGSITRTIYSEPFYQQAVVVFDDVIRQTPNWITPVLYYEYSKVGLDSTGILSGLYATLRPVTGGYAIDITEGFYKIGHRGIYFKPFSLTVSVSDLPNTSTLFFYGSFTVLNCNSFVDYNPIHFSIDSSIPTSSSTVLYFPLYRINRSGTVLQIDYVNSLMYRLA